MNKQQNMGITNGPADVTVVIAAYNAGKTIERTIKSVALSVIPVHLVVVDDGSNDNTGALLTELQVFWPFVILYQENKGLGAARAAGCAIADTDWIVLLDSDDESTPDRFSKQLDAGRAATGPVLVSCGTQVLSDGHCLTKKCVFAEVNVGTGVDISKAFIAGKRLPSGASMMIQRSLYEEIGGFNPKFRRQCELDFFSRAIAQNVHFVCVPEPLYIQHVGLESSTAQTSGRIQAFRWLFENWERMLYETSSPEINENIMMFIRSRIRILSLGTLRWDYQTRMELCQMALTMSCLSLNDKLILISIRSVPNKISGFIFHNLKRLKYFLK